MIRLYLEKKSNAISICSNFLLNPFHSRFQYTDTLANSEGPDEMSHKAAFHLGGSALFPKLKTIFIRTYDSLMKHKMDYPILIVPLRETTLVSVAFLVVLSIFH